MKKNINYSPTWVEVDLNAIVHNFKQIKKIVSREACPVRSKLSGIDTSNRVKVLATVKANAYGHGIIEVSKKLTKAKVDYLGVSSIDEALKIRKAKIKAPVLIMGCVFKKDVEPIIDKDVSLTIDCLERAKFISAIAKSKNRHIPVHIKVDTGMGRIGIWHKNALEQILKIKKLNNIVIEGIFTHFSSADNIEEENFTQEQIAKFSNLLSKIEKNRIKIPVVHSANSMATLFFKDAHFNLVRPGLILYGIYPRINRDGSDFIDIEKPGTKIRTVPIYIKPALSLKTKIVSVKELPKGTSISYGRTYVLKKDSVIAILPVGYSDGYPVGLSNKSYVLIKGKRAPVIGRICMDYMIIDVTNIPNVKIGSEVVLIGKQGENEIKISELADMADTIPYEILCRINSRIKRLYRG